MNIQKATRLIWEQDDVKMQSKAIVMNNLLKKRNAQIKELIVPSMQSTNAFTMNLKSKMRFKRFYVF